MAKAKKTDSPSVDADASAPKTTAKKTAKKAASAKKTTAASDKPSTAAKATSAKGTTKTAAKSGASKSTAAKSGAAQSSPIASPLIDTDLAAASAARMLLARAAGNVSPTAPSTVVASSELKQLKEAVSKPKGALDNLLHSTAPKNAARTNVPFNQQRQVGHNQTFGADVNRTGVPRRTSSGG